MITGNMFEVIRREEAPFVIAEMANAHEGSADTAREIIAAAAGAGVDAIKLQKFTGDELLVPTHPRHQHFTDLEMSDDQWAVLVADARGRGLYVLADVFGAESAALMQRLGVDGFKIHSSDTVNRALIRQVAAYGKPVFLSCGGSRQIEIREAVALIRQMGNEQIVLLHGFQNYPTRLEDTHLNRVQALARQFSLPVGYADHVAGDSDWAVFLPLMAVAAGASVIEKHVTLDRARKGIDYFSSAEPQELKSLVGLLRDAWKSRGRPYDMTGGELKYLHEVKKLMVATRDIAAGETIDASMITYKRAPADVQPLREEEVIGRVCQVALRKNDVISLNQFGLKAVALIAVRMHSTRLPRKALLPLAGRPALEHLIERVQQAKSVAAVVLCTSTHPDDAVLISIAERMGIRWFRGSEDDVMLRFLDAADREAADVVVRVTGDDVLIDSRILDRAVAHHLAKNADYTCYSGLPKGMETEVISVSALKMAHRLAEDPSFSEYMTNYLKRPDVFRVIDMPVEAPYARPFRLTLDTQEDYQLLQTVFELLARPGGMISTEEIIALLDARPDLLAINAGVRPKSVVINASLRMDGACQK